MPNRLFTEDRLDAWYDGSAICVIAIGSYGDPVDLSDAEVRALIKKLELCLIKSQQPQEDATND